MVFKGRFFSSKKSDTSTPDGSSNSPRSLGSNSDSPIRSDKKKPKSTSSSVSKDCSPAASPRTAAKIKRRSGPLPQEKSLLENVDNGINSDMENVLQMQQRSRLQNAEPSSGATGQTGSTWGDSGALRNSDVRTPEMKTSYDCDNPKESESPRFQAILRVTSAPRKRFPGDIKSFSHELNSKGVHPCPYWKPRRLNNLEDVLAMIRTKFEKSKEEVDSDLHVFAADLVGILEKNAETHPDWQETVEDLLVLARSYAMTSPGEFWLQCEGIVQELDDRRQELPMGTLKQLHTRMLFILTRCTRLLQFHKESGFADDEHAVHPS